MPDNISMNCQDIKKHLQRFQEDLLVDKEYQAYVTHLERCSKCKEYVQSIGALSTQVWALGNVKVPSDLSSSVIFKLKHPQKEVKEPRPDAVRYLWIIGIVMVFVLSALFLSIHFMKAQSETTKDRKSRKLTKVTAISGEKTSPFSSGVASIDDTVHEMAEGKPEDIEGIEMNITYHDLNADGQKTASSKLATHHWHIRLYEQINKTGQNEEIIQKDRELKKSLAEMEKVKREIKRLKDEGATGFKQHYSEQARSKAMREEQKRAQSLQEELAEQDLLEKLINRIKRERTQLEYSLRQSMSDQQRQEVELKGKLFSKLNALNINHSYDAHNVLSFTAFGNESEQVLEQVLLISEMTDSFLDFTSETSMHPERKYYVTLYFDQEEDDNYHWHVNPDSPVLKSRLLDVINEFSQSMHYQSKRVVVFSIARSNIEKLQRKIQAMRVPFSKFGGNTSGKNELISGHTTISIYFAH